MGQRGRGGIAVRNGVHREWTERRTEELEGGESAAEEQSLKDTAWTRHLNTVCCTEQRNRTANDFSHMIEGGKSSEGVTNLLKSLF